MRRMRGPLAPFAPLLAACALTTTWAAGSMAAEPAPVSGKVVDAAGSPIADAEVSVADLKLRTVTGADGSFSFAALPPGRYTLSARRVGFAPAVIPFAAPLL